MTNNHEAEFDARDLRRAFGHFATGVTIVTTLDTAGNPCGFTANSFTSVSIEPPLLLVSIAKSAHGCDVFTGSLGFAVNILSASQRDLSNRFARAGEDKFSDLDYQATNTRSPVIDNVVAWFDCRTYQQVDAGDHIILIGEVVDYHYNTYSPLGFCRGVYVSFGLTPQMLQLVSSPGRLSVGAIIESNGRILLERNPENGQLVPPTSNSVGDAETPGSLLGKLASAGIEVDLPFIYAAYYENSERSIYYLGELLSLQDTTETWLLRFYEFDHITWEEIGDPAIISMLERFVHEKKLGYFKVYIGDQDHGEIYPT